MAILTIDSTSFFGNMANQDHISMKTSLIQWPPDPYHHKEILLFSLLLQEGEMMLVVVLVGASLMLVAMTMERKVEQPISTHGS